MDATLSLLNGKLKNYAPRPSKYLKIIDEI